MTSDNLLTHDCGSLRHALIQLKVWPRFIDSIIRQLEISLTESVTLLNNAGSTEVLLWITPNLGDGNRPTAHVCIAEKDLSSVRINKIAENQYQLELWGGVGVLVNKYGYLLFGESSYRGTQKPAVADNVFTDKQMTALIGESAVGQISGEGSFHQFNKEPLDGTRVQCRTYDIFHKSPAYRDHDVDDSPLYQLIHTFDLNGVVVHRVPGGNTYLVEGLSIAYCLLLKRLVS